MILGGTGPHRYGRGDACAGRPARDLVERIDELSLQRHDFGGNANALLGGFVRRIDRLKAELIGPDDYARWASYLEADDSDPSEAAIAHEFAEVYRTHARILAEAGARDDGDLVRDALRRVREQPGVAKRFEHVLIDDAQELDLAPASLALEVAGSGLTAAATPHMRSAGLRVPAPSGCAASPPTGHVWSSSSAASAVRSRSSSVARAVVDFECAPRPRARGG